MKDLYSNRQVYLEAPLGYKDELYESHYIKECVLDSISRGELPYYPHQLFLSDGTINPSIYECKYYGIDNSVKPSKMVVYTDFGITQGMLFNIKNAMMLKIPVIYRTLEDKKLDIAGDGFWFEDVEGLEMGIDNLRREKKDKNDNENAPE